MKKTHTLHEAEYGRDALAKVSIIHLLNRWKRAAFSNTLILYYIGMCWAI
jgi:hypothetical protein